MTICIHNEDGFPAAEAFLKELHPLPKRLGTVISADRSLSRCASCSRTAQDTGALPARNRCTRLALSLVTEDGARGLGVGLTTNDFGVEWTVAAYEEIEALRRAASDPDARARGRLR